MPSQRVIAANECQEMLPLPSVEAVTTRFLPLKSCLIPILIKAAAEPRLDLAKAHAAAELTSLVVSWPTSQTLRLPPKPLLGAHLCCLLHNVAITTSMLV